MDGDVDSATAELTGAEDAIGAPAVVNNVETFANLALIVARGPSWFRDVGTTASPGTIVCAIVGDTRRHGVAEFAPGFGRLLLC